MTIDLDHIIVPARDRIAAAEQLATLLGVPWERQAAVGPFTPVYVSKSLTLDFTQMEDDVPRQHYAFRVSPEEFDAIIERIKAAGLPYRSGPQQPADMKINTYGGGRGVYWDQPDGHVWEILTVSYARQP